MLDEESHINKVKVTKTTALDVDENYGRETRCIKGSELHWRLLTRNLLQSDSRQYPYYFIYLLGKKVL